MKRKFLVPVGTIAAAIATEYATAAVAPADAIHEPREMGRTANDVAHALEPQNLTVRAGDDAYDFVLKRTQSGQVMAYHSSHSSHSSHYSHRSSSS
ncbi:His-Xaa-Ser repeat protein HxsA2 [Paraburkholderia caballeronis]|uniref:Peptidase propeptide and YPEB domain-containing protein n=1 Tax=Paraburkholderia caballeronis TaxID=416943 RepID=A0A1H7MVI2_9BURK|nr:His-Xaa-Ser repeat protein HxsA2 [Paraburkholderia caballeronis]PXW26422.1 hypothetical protein C7403_104296 [Paraburkholderia caballeronis]PXX01969.1 hypothetical protein C7407_104296 [Paraburkholderia caballeronis]RAK01126.1 hypothetical protein C7409_104296 [Paraburkholderia caballeronis]SEB96555.1 hypothetical protein SAMN05445871_1399 [Paraburkholderia caballeronis]SEL14607.1 hypothetical protein SAMN05192542_105173 [Paraburkholderia caballeronis]